MLSHKILYKWNFVILPVEVVCLVEQVSEEFLVDGYMLWEEVFAVKDEGHEAGENGILAGTLKEVFFVVTVAVAFFFGNGFIFGLLGGFVVRIGFAIGVWGGCKGSFHVL